MLTKKPKILMNVAMVCFFMIITSSIKGQENLIQIKGIVTSAFDEETLPGVNITIKGTNEGTVTDIDGEYILNAQSDAVLLFSSVGYITEEIMVDARQTIDVSLTPTIEMLEEFVVIGYSRQRKQDLSSSIGVMDIEDLLKMPGGLVSALQGSVAGVQVSDNRIRIRGTGSINNTDPLYVVDGLIGGAPPNENDIASVQILKDAAASAIYGARASNGVIIITTKRGQSGEPVFDYHTYSGFRQPAKKLELLNAQQMAELANEAVHNYKNQYPNRPVSYAEAYYYPDSLGLGTDWQDAWFQTGWYTDHNLAISGGSDNFNFRVSGNYSSRTGMIISDERESYGLNVTSELSKGRFTIGESFVIQRNDIIRNEQPITEVWRMTPNIPIYDEDNLGGYAGPGLEDKHDMQNPIGLANLTDNESNNLAVRGSAWLNFEIMDNLNYKFNLGYSNWNAYNYLYVSRYELGPQRVRNKAQLTETHIRNQRFLYENTLSYDFSLSNHNVLLLAGITSENFSQRRIQGYGEDFASDNLRVFNAASDHILSGNANEWAMFSLLGRLTYDYNRKYLMTANIRRDGSSRFSSVNRYGVFPSFSFAWRMDQENFIANNFDFINELKPRFSYGVLGSDLVPAYGYDSFLNMIQTHVFGGLVVPAYLPTTFGTPGLKWETLTSLDIGLDIGLFNDNLMLNFDYFDSTTDDILIRVPVPTSSGIDGSSNAPFLNAGSIQNKGYEISALYRNSASEFSYQISANYAAINNTVIKLGDQGDPIISGRINPNGYNITRTEEGNSIGDFYVWLTDGIYQNQEDIDAMNKPQIDDQGDVMFNEQGDTIFNIFAPNAMPGDIRFKDLNGDGILGEEDRKNVGSPIPDFTFGLSFDMGYKGFDFSMMMHGVYGNKIYNQGKYFMENMMHYSNNNTTTLDRWRGEDLYFVHPDTGEETFYPANTDTDVPRAVLNDPNGNIRRASDRFIEDGSFLRINRVTIGYTFPASMSNAMSLQNLRIYAGARNLLTFSGYSGYDPEVGDRGTHASYNLNRGIDVQNPFGAPTYPKAREFFAGVQITF